MDNIINASRQKLCMNMCGNMVHCERARVSEHDMIALIPCRRDTTNKKVGSRRGKESGLSCTIPSKKGKGSESHDDWKQRNYL